MNPSNPFQIPSCLHRADLQQRRRERFRQGVVACVAAVVVFLVVLLIQGCMSEHAKTSTAVGNAPKEVVVPAEKISAPEPMSPVPSGQAVPAPVATAIASAAVVHRADDLYVVKSGDNLTKIAKLNHTTVKALKAVNGLTNDMLAVGAKLKLPSA